MTARCRWCGQVIARSLAGSVWRARGLSFCPDAPGHEHLPQSDKRFTPEWRRRSRLRTESPESPANGLPGTK